MYSRLDISHTQYLNAIWSVINFEEAEKRFTEATGGARL